MLHAFDGHSIVREQKATTTLVGIARPSGEVAVNCRSGAKRRVPAVSKVGQVTAITSVEKCKFLAEISRNLST